MHLLLRVQVLAMALLNSGLIALVLHEMHAGCIFTFSCSVQWQCCIIVREQKLVQWEPSAFYNMDCYNIYVIEMLWRNLVNLMSNVKLQ